jgi:hypothetical protein
LGAFFAAPRGKKPGFPLQSFCPPYGLQKGFPLQSLARVFLKILL